MTSTSYANAAKSTQFPTKEQAILVDALQAIRLAEYVEALAQKIPASQIRFASRIANNRICIYLASESIAETAIETHKTINIEGSTLQIRPLISKNKRIILSNVSPIIPHTDIEKLLTTDSVSILVRLYRDTVHEAQAPLPRRSQPNGYIGFSL